MTGSSASRFPLSIALAVFSVSFCALAWQLGLMRCLLIARYHHFSFLIISCALLGFGVSGTFLYLFRAPVQRHQEEVLSWALLAFAVSIPVCLRLGETVPLTVYFAPGDFLRAVGWWVLFWIVHTFPFLVAGTAICLSLMISGEVSNTVYGASLLGSAAGAAGGITLLGMVPPNGLAVPLSLLAMLGSLPFVLVMLRSLSRAYWGAFAACAIALGISLFTRTDIILPLNIDQHKILSYVRILEQQGSARNTLTLNGIRGRIDVFSSPHFHSLLSLNSEIPPPPMDIILKDGFQVGSIPIIGVPEEAGFVEGTLFALPYKLVKPDKVLILGEAGGVQIWLARRSSARLIVLVQPDPNVVEVLTKHSSQLLKDPRIRVEITEPRAFLDHTDLKFDIVQLAALEAFSPGSVGVGGLREDYLATVEGFAKCIESLSLSGVACVVRGIQDPPRDNIKIPATWIEALEWIGLPDPGERIAMARDELACATVASRAPLSPKVIDNFRQTCAAMSWDAEWFPGVRPEDTNRFHVFPGPPGTIVSWYYHALQKLLSPQRNDFYREWLCWIRPATDDRPFFYDFFRWSAFTKLREIFGPLWPTRSELGFLMLILSLGWTVIAAGILLSTPIFILLRRKQFPSIPLIVWMVVFFSAIGCGFMFLEISLIQIFTRFLGDPVVAAAVVLGGFLFFAGVGSMTQPYVIGRIRFGITVVLAGAAVTILAESVMIPKIFQVTSGIPIVGKVIIALALMVPLGFPLGMAFPWGLSILRRNSEGTMPLAWAVNGFSSVISSSLAVVLAMTYGFTALWVLTACAYCLAGGISLACRTWLKSERSIRGTGPGA
jgi:hypothetical protein